MNDRFGHESERFLQSVQQFAELVLEKGRDRYGEYSTPLLVDGIRADNGEPVTWRSGETWVLSNLANQQNLFRLLYGLSMLTGKPDYYDAAAAILDYSFTDLRYGDLFCWGGHMAFDLQRKKQVHATDKGPQHELKCHYPFYELMFEINGDETKKYIEALWESHILDWSNLEFSRHGQPAADRDRASVWDHAYEGSGVFFTGKGLTFVNAGSDLYYAAAMLHVFGGEEQPLLWAKRLARRYVETRDPITGMGGYQFSISILPGVRGDRAIEQFGEQLKAHSPLESTLSIPRQIHTIIGEAAMSRMVLAERLGEAGREFLLWAIEDLLAYGKHAYQADDNTIHPILTNGTRLTGLVMEKDGYYGKKGERLKAEKADSALLWSYLTGYRLSGEPLLWEIARSMAADSGLGDIGRSGGKELGLNFETSCDDPLLLFAMLECYQATENEKFLELAVLLGENMLRERFHNGYFLPSRKHLYVKFDAIEPLALLHLIAAIRGSRHLLPRYFGGKPFFGAAYDGYSHEKDNSFIYARTK